MGPAFAAGPISLTQGADTGENIMAIHRTQAYPDAAAYLAVFQPDISSLYSSEAASFREPGPFRLELADTFP